MNIFPWMNIISLNEYIFLNEYDFLKWICFPWMKIIPWINIVSLNEYNFLEINITPWTNIISLNEYIFVNKYMFFEWIKFPWKLRIISFPWSWINTIPWSCINIQLLDVKWFLEYKYILVNVNTYISWILQQRANHNQLAVVTQANTNYDLLVLWVSCKQRPLLSRHEKCFCIPTTNPPLSLKFAFSLKTSDRGCTLCADVSENRFLH